MSGDGEMIDLGVRQGDVLAGKYQLGRVLGAGGMGVVVAAHHLQLDERVALKFLLPKAANDAGAVARFVREARAAVRIKSEHVARVTDVGELENGTPYMAMEYLEGRDLDAWLQESGPMAPEQAVEFTLQACEAMAEAHGLGIIHRDLKPSNLFCVRRADGRLSVKVLDFGISKVTSATDSPRVASMTRTDAVVGSPAYMSPEQLQMSSGVDARTDIWSLGVLLFELLCGRLPFEGEAATALAINIATMAPLALRSVRPDVPIGLEKVVMACLEKDRERRYQDVGELAKALEPFGPERAKVSVERVMATVQAGRGVRVAPSPPPVALPTRAPGSGTPTATMMNWGETGRAGHRRRNALVGVILAAVVAAGVVILATKASEPLGTATASSSRAALGPAPTPAPPGPSASTAPSDRSTPPTVSPSDLPLAPPPRTTPSGNRAPKVLAAPSAAARSGASATTAATPPAAPAYNPLEHL